MDKTLGEMSPEEQEAAIRQAVTMLQAELEAMAPAIAKILEDNEDGR